MIEFKNLLGEREYFAPMEGLLYLALHSSSYTPEQCIKLDNIFQKCGNKTAKQAFPLMYDIMDVESLDSSLNEKNKLFKKFVNLCDIYAHDYDLDRKIKFSELINWAIKRNINIPKDVFLLYKEIHNNTNNNITFSEHKITELEAQLSELQKENAALKEKLAELESKEPCEIPGLLKYFIGKRKEGLSDYEIVQELIRIEIPRSALGAILRPDIEPIKNYGQWVDDNIRKKEEKDEKQG